MHTALSGARSQRAASALMPTLVRLAMILLLSFSGAFAQNPRGSIVGFKRFVRDAIQVRTSEAVEAPIRMELGATSDTVEVKAQTPLLDTSDASLGRVGSTVHFRAWTRSSERRSRAGTC
jgi:hypothetical protein